MHKSLFVVVAAWATAAFASPPKAITPALGTKFDRAKIAISYSRDVLANGLTLLVHEDRSVPVVAVHLWYNIGSRNEVPGTTGLAHLFEHLFSEGSEHYPHNFRSAMNDVGATNLNGFTDLDRTLFFEDIPASALERTLYLESDRMGFLEKQISTDSLDRQRGIVQNEKSQGEGAPYGGVQAQIAEAIYPSTHPYSRTTMGSIQDLASVSVENVRAWYRTYYGPNNCVLSLAGDVTRERAVELVTKYFGDIAPGPPLRRIKELLPRLAHSIRAEAEQRVPQARVYRIYHAPGWRSADIPLLKLAASVLSGSSSARLDRQLVSEKQLVTNVRAKVEVGELASQFSVVATTKAGIDPEAAEREIDAIINDFLRGGPTADELRRAKMRELAGFVRAHESLAARAELLAESMTYAGKPDAYLDRLEVQANATADQVKRAAETWLGTDHYTLTVKPHPPLTSAKTTIDRSTLPSLDVEAADIGFPALQKTTLTNGLKVILLERHSMPVVRCALVVDAGYAADPPPKRGLASLTMALLTKGTASRNGMQMIDRLDDVGARLIAWNTLDVSVVSFEALSTTLDHALDIYSDAVLHPVFPAEAVEVSRQQRIADMAQDKADPGRTGMNFVRRLLYGDTHPYAVPLSGLGSEQTISAITRDDVVAWHRTWFQPSNSTLVIFGDAKMAELLPQLERTFGGWKQSGAPEKKLIAVTHAARPKIYLLDHPDAQQSVIVGAHVSEPGGQPDDLAIAAVMKGLGGMVSSRLNRNLRVEKQWSYNAWATLLPSRGARTFLVFAPVRTDKTKESLIEIVKELRAISGEKPIVGEEFASVMRTATLSLPGRFATLSALEDASIDMLTYGYADDYYAKLGQHLHALTEEDLASAARKYIRPDHMIWIIRGDLAKIEASIRETGLGDIVRVDADGRSIN